MRIDIDLYSTGIRPEDVSQELTNLREDFRAHNHDGTSSKKFETLVAETVNARTILIRKTSYTDTTAGIWMGLVNGDFRMKLGNATQYLEWDGTQLLVTGTVSGTTFNGITITGSTISGTNITGGTIKTSNTSTRVEMNGNDNALYVYTSGIQRISLIAGAIGFYDSAGLQGGGLQAIGDQILRISSSDSAGAAVLMDHGDLLPEGIGTNNLGDAGNYWNDVSYKTLTDRGCIGFYDEGVKLRDGRIVSDTEALLSIKPHPTKKTPRGVTRLDYRTMPKDVYVQATLKGKILPRDENDDPYFIDKNGNRVIAQDGAETTALIGIMLGAIKELTLRIKALESR